MKSNFGRCWTQRTGRDVEHSPPGFSGVTEPDSKNKWPAKWATALPGDEDQE